MGHGARKWGSGPLKMVSLQFPRVTPSPGLPVEVTSPFLLPLILLFSSQNREMRNSSWAHPLSKAVREFLGRWECILLTPFSLEVKNFLRPTLTLQTDPGLPVMETVCRAPPACGATRKPGWVSAEGFDGHFLCASLG